MELMSRQERVASDHENKWSELPQDMLDLIAQLLTTPQDFCRFGAVCTSWRKAAIQPNYNPISDHQLPWFIIPSTADHKLSSVHTGFLNEYCFYDPCTSRTRELQHSPSMPVEIIGAGHGWVGIYEHHAKEVVLFNPLRKTLEIIGLLPPFTSDTGISHVNLILSGSPRDGSFKGLMYYYAEKNLMLQLMAHVILYASGDPQWRRIHGGNGEMLSLDNFTFFKDRLYAFHATNETLVVLNEEESEPSGGLMFTDVLKLPSHIRLTLNGARYLVSGGENLLVCMSPNQEPYIRGYIGSERQWIWGWQVYKVELKTKESNGGRAEAEVVKMDGLGDGAVFISDKSSHYVSKLPSGGDCRFKRNSIYFHSVSFWGEKRYMFWESSLEDGTTKPFYTINEMDTDYIPSVWLVPMLW